jgi:hypothetical protein
MSDQASYDRNKAAIKQKDTPLNKGPAQVPCSPNQSPATTRPTNHVDPGTGKRS